MNRSGGEAVLFFGFLLIMVILIGGIVFGIASFYGKPYDFKEVDAAILNEKIRVCVQTNDFFSDSFEIVSDCGLNGNILEDQYLISIKSGEKDILVGVRDYLNQCDFKGGEDNQAYPKCYTQSFSYQGKSYTIVTGSGQLSRRGTYVS